MYPNATFVKFRPNGGTILQNPNIGGNAITAADTDYITDGYLSTYSAVTDKQYFTFQAPDYYFLGNSFTWASGDMIVFEETPEVSTAGFVNKPASDYASSFKVIRGVVTTPLELEVTDAQF